ncbi:class I SAM-dependent methyltransferase [Streptomyces sp. NPDC006544]|uniref:class I SAM-dependent methyltransferase n=1 Tax=Streptomyces sp. NPDC006544 TaxID=3154583 RepID=UPI0033A25D67
MSGIQAPRAGEDDRYHISWEKSTLRRKFAAEAFGEEYPAEADPSSNCTWSVLAAMVRGLRMRTGEVLVDLGCGRGGPGLWVARAVSVRLIGVDHSPVGLELAAARASHFLLPDRVRFQLGTFDATGLPDACADGLISMDALPIAPDRDAALREVRRILRPGARAVFTGSDRLPGHPTYTSNVPTWRDRIARAGLELEIDEDRAEARRQWQRWYALWEQHEAQLRAEMGDEAAEAMLEEARFVGPLLPHMRLGLFTVRAPLC